MSAPPTNALSIPPWKPLLNSHLQSNPPPSTFSLATISPNPVPTPRVRTLVFRGFLTSLPENKHNPLYHPPPSNDPGLDIFTFTTDARSHKALHEIFHGTGRNMLVEKGGGKGMWIDAVDSPHHRHRPSVSVGEGGRKAGELVYGSGGGGMGEMCFWLAHTNHQWRIRGPVYLLSLDDIETDAAHVKKLRHRLAKRLGVEEGEVQWQREVLAQFANLAPAMRGSFGGPWPGEPVAEGGQVAKPISNEEVESMEGDVGKAKRNFRVGVVVPEWVERLDLSAREKAGARWTYTREVDDEFEEEADEEGKSDELRKIERDGREAQRRALGGKVVNGWRVVETWP